MDSLAQSTILHMPTSRRIELEEWSWASGSQNTFNLTLEKETTVVEQMQQDEQQFLVRLIFSHLIVKI